MKLCLFLFCFVIYTCNNEENEENKREGKEFIHVNNEENEEKKREGKEFIHVITKRTKRRRGKESN